VGHVFLINKGDFMRIVLSVLLFLSSTLALSQGMPRETVTINGATYYLGYIPGHAAQPTYSHPRIFDLPLVYNAVEAGKATPVKAPGQGQCGDCWAWARTSSLEAAVLAAGHSLSLSEQDTTVNARNEHGCQGGMMDFDYEIQHGVSLLSTCPWHNGTGRCKSKPAAKATNMAFIGDADGPTDAELMTAIYEYGSVAVTVAADDNFDVAPGTDTITSCDTTQVDHMVSLVGYRTMQDGSVQYLMKNSWGSSWGVNGYAYIAKGCDQLATGDQSAMYVTIQ
jgi:C1A family cysteine protease